MIQIEQWLDDAFRQHQAGQGSAAEAGYRRVLSMQPRNVRALYLLGSLLAQQGNYQEALAPLTQAAILDPLLAEAHNNRGIALKELGRTEEALAAYDQALAARHTYAEATNNKGTALQTLGRLSEALVCFTQATELQPAYAEAWNNRGIVLNTLERREEAAVCFTQTLQLQPDSARAHNNLGNVRMGQMRFEDALASYDRALALQENSAEIHSNRGTALKELSRFDEARAAFARALSLQPTYPDALSNLATCLLTEGRISEAMEAYDLALTLDTQHVDARWNRALALLMTGDWANGWSEYEWRFRKHVPPPVSDAPRWDGSALDGKTILVIAEQGAGDTIKFVRYLPLVQARGGRVVLVCPPALRALMESCAGVDALAAPDEDVPHDLQIPLLSLPGVFGTTPETIPAPKSYLTAPPERKDIWRKKVNAAAAPGAVKVGLCWAGNPDQKNDHNRSCTLAGFAPLASAPGVVFFSLQKGPAAAQAARPPRGMTLVDLTEEIHDFADTAALMSGLDLIITVDTSVAHLAGALGRSVWTLLPFAAPWHYLIGRTDSPWYPTMDLFQQRVPRDWSGVLSRVAQALTTAIAVPLCESLLESGEAAFASGDIGAARQAFHQAREIMPDHPRALSNLAVLAYAEGKHKDAIEYLEYALAQNPEDLLLLENLSRCRIALGEYAAAADALERALACDPERGDLRATLAVCRTKSSPPVSIVVPCYKQAHLLPDTVASVVAQTYANWEMMIVNDGSPDNTSDVARELIARYPQCDIQLIEKPNGGLSAARNTGFAAAQGEFFLPLDSDDRLHPQFLEKTVAALQEQPDAALAFTDVQHFGRLTDIYPTGPFTLESQKNENRMSYCALMRRALFQTLGGYDPTCIAYEDWDFWLRVLEKGMTAAHLGEPLFIYRTAENSKLMEDNKQRDRFVSEIVMRHRAIYEPNRVARAAACLQAPPPPEAGAFVSVIVPCYKYAHCLPECVESVVAQTYANWEMMIVNDDSPDNTSDVARELIARFPQSRIRLIEKPNAGVGAARNTGIEASQGQYLLPLDADDKLHPEFLAKTVAALDAEPEAAIAFTDVRFFGTQDKIWQCGPMSRDFLRLTNTVAHCCLFRRMIYDTVGGYRTAAGYEDWEFWLDALDRGARTVHVPEPLFFYRQWAQSKFTEDSKQRARFEAEIVLRHPHLYHPSRLQEAEATRTHSVTESSALAGNWEDDAEDSGKLRVILAMNWFYPHVGGEERLSEDIGAALAEAGFTVEVATRWLAERTEFTYRGMRIHSLSGTVGDEFRRLVEARKPHAVVIIGGPEIDFLPASAAFPADGSRVIIVPCIKPDSYRDVHAIPTLRHALESAAGRADVTVCSSRHGYDARLFSDLNIPSVYVPNAVHRTEPQGDFRAQYGIPKDKPLLLDVSNMRREKNHAGLLHHLRDLPGDWHLALIGCPFEPTPHVFTHVKHLAEMDPRVTLIPGAPAEIIAAAMEDADLLLLPSLADATPLVLIEAMSHGLPWIATPECGSAHDHAGGLMLPLAQFGAAIDWVFQHPEARTALSEAGFAHWQACYTYDVIGPRYAALVSGKDAVPDLLAPSHAKAQTDAVRAAFAAQPAQAPAAPSKVAVSVIIPTRNRAPILRKALDAFRGQTLPPQYFEVIVVDDGSTDGTAQMLAQAAYPFSVTTVRVKPPQGEAHARNLALLRAKGEVVVLADDDLAAAPNYLEQHLRTHQKYPAPHVGVLGRITPAADVANSVTHHILTHSDALEQNFDALHDGEGVDARALATGTVSVKRTFLLGRGIFAPEAGTQLHAELAWRLKDDGLQFCYNPQAVAYALHAPAFTDYCARQAELGWAAAHLTRTDTDPEMLFWLDVHNAEDRLAAQENPQAAAAQIGTQLAALENAGLAALTQKPDFSTTLLPALTQLCTLEAVRHRLTAYRAERDLLLSQDSETPGSEAAKVSVVIPCYKYARYLPGAIASLAAQTYPHWEAVIVDDGSPDDTIAVAESLIAAYPDQNIRLITQENTGHPSFARNRGITETDGAYVLCLDADDEIAPTFLADCVDLLDRNSHLSIAYTDQWRFTNEGQGEYFSAGDWHAAHLSQYLPLGVCSLFRRQAWVDTGGWRAVGYEDWDFWLACAEHGHRGRRIAKPLYRYRKHDEGKYVQDEGQGFLHKAWLAVNHPALHHEAQRRWAWGVIESDRWLRLPEWPAPSVPVSVILTTTGRDLRRLTQAIESIRAQSLAGVEIIVSGTGDAALGPLSGVRVLQPALPLSEIEARNRGLQAATGQYIAYLTEDARFEPRHLETLVGFLENTHFAAAYADVAGDDGPGAGKHFDYHQILVQPMAPLVGLVHARTCVNKIGGFDTSLPSEADWEFVLRLSRFFDIARLKTTTAAYLTPQVPAAPPAARAQAVRQIYERYQTLVKDLPKLQEAQSQVLRNLETSSTPTPESLVLSASVCRQYGLDPYGLCVCGSGKKLKFCHYNEAIDGEWLTANAPASTNTSEQSGSPKTLAAA